MSNPFFTGQDVDDDEFLNHSRTGNKGYMLSNNSTGGGGRWEGQGSPDPLQQLMERKREIEQRTLESSNRSVGLLYESERTGQATAEELTRQKEQLKQTEARLNDINTTLRQSEKHLQGIKSLFGGVRNYFRGGNAAAAPVSTSQNHSQATAAAGSSAVAASDAAMSRLDGMRDASHPGLRVQGRAEDNSIRSGGYPSSTDEVNAALDRNLDEMSLGLGRLKGLAQNLNSELEDHNDLIDRIDTEASKAGLKINKQNRDMDKLLKKK